LQNIQSHAADAKVVYSDGTDLKTAAELARTAEVAIVFVNQPMTEALDAQTLSLPDNQDAIVSAVAAANPRTIVVLETGGPVSMPWIDQVGAVIEAWYPGVNGAQALANILFGSVNPSGKLTASFAKTDADLPHPQIPGMDLVAGHRWKMPPFDIPYSEGLKVGYKWFEAEHKEPLFAFGFGLSYTQFAYSDLQASLDSVTFSVRNTGDRAGAEIAQVYASLPATAQEPPKRLVAWQRIPLAAGESKTVTLPIDPKFLSIFDVQKDSWDLLPGEYTFLVGGSSNSTPLKATATK
jgi:beta-glucosidase